MERDREMELNSKVLSQLRDKYGDAFYLLDTAQFKANYVELKEAFSSLYSNFNIAYSYKTNYTPKLCKIVNEFDGYAEVVSEMEAELALRIGVCPKKVIWNGPIKNPLELKKFLLQGGSVNIDSLEECLFIKKIAEQFPDHTINVGIRCNFDVRNGELSRFGLDIDSNDFKKALDFIKMADNLKMISLQCHFANRQIEFWPARAKSMIDVIDRTGIVPERIDLGGGLFGKMEDSLREQLSIDIPDYTAYAKAAATLFSKHFCNMENKPELLIEPGTALVGDCMKFVGTIKTIKKVRGKTIATVLGSQKNISMTGVNPPMKIYAMGEEQREYENADFAGFTCIESDMLYKEYTGKFAIGDMVVISNCGSYSLVMKPPFIVPNFPVIDISQGQTEVIKQAETFDDIFHTYNI